LPPNEIMPYEKTPQADLRGSNSQAFPPAVQT
jgi:hypothetical protein